MANYGRYSTHTEWLNPSVQGRFFRLISNNFATYICLKFEMFGCITKRDNRNCKRYAHFRCIPTYNYAYC